MKARTALSCAAGLLGLVAGFWLYGVGRSMAENVGFELASLFAGLYIAVLVPIPFVFPCAALALWRGHSPNACLATYTACLVLGSLVSEVSMLVDEARFRAEIAAHLELPHNRARAWPNETVALVYWPDRGIHATD
jgi:hypothetical protein